MQIRTFRVTFRFSQPHTGESWSETFEAEATDRHAARDMAEYDAECEAERHQAEANYETTVAA